MNVKCIFVVGNPVTKDANGKGFVADVNTQMLIEEEFERFGDILQVENWNKLTLANILKRATKMVIKHLKAETFNNR